MRNGFRATAFLRRLLAATVLMAVASLVVVRGAVGQEAPIYLQSLPVSDKITVDITLDGCLFSESFRIKYERSQLNVVEVALLTSRQIKGKRGEKSHTESVEDGPYHAVSLTDDQIKRLDNALDYCRSTQVHIAPRPTLGPPYLTTYIVKQYHDNELQRTETIQTYGSEQYCLFVDADPDDLVALKLENKPILSIAWLSDTALAPLRYKPAPTTYIGFPRSETPAYRQLHPPPPEPRTLFPQSASNSSRVVEERNDDLEHVLDGTWQMNVKDDHGPHYRELWLDRKHRFMLSDRPPGDVAPHRRYEGTWECRGDTLYLKPEQESDFDLTALFVAHEPLNDRAIHHPAITLIPPADLSYATQGQIDEFRCLWKVRHAYADNAFPAEQVAKAIQSLPSTGASQLSPKPHDKMPSNP